MPYLAKGAASYLALQLDQLNWPAPDLIVPIPQSLFHSLQRGYHPTALMALELGALIEKPVSCILKASFGAISQKYLSREERLSFRQKSFSLKKGVSLANQTILLVDDVISTGGTLNAAYRALLPANPKQVLAIALCGA
jgi:predicted amidophosphoribosyltransferase